MMTPYDTGETKETSDKPEENFGQKTELRPSREEAEKAVEVLLRWIGENPNREGLVGTPGRVVRAWTEFCSGYEEDPVQLLARTFEAVSYTHLTLPTILRV